MDVERYSNTDKSGEGADSGNTREAAAEMTEREAGEFLEFAVSQAPQDQLILPLPDYRMDGIHERHTGSLLEYGFEGLVKVMEKWANDNLSPVDYGKELGKEVRDWPQGTKNDAIAKIIDAAPFRGYTERVAAVKATYGELFNFDEYLYSDSKGGEYTLITPTVPQFKDVIAVSRADNSVRHMYADGEYAPPSAGIPLIWKNLREER